MSLVLYDNRGSTNALKVRFLLGELGLEARLVDVPLGDAPPSYLALHPFGLVPTLVDGDVVIPQSHAALRYLADRERRDDLYPRDPAARARVEVLLDTLSLEVRPALWAAEEPAIYGLPADADWEPGLVAALDAFETLLAPGGFATGSFTIADCAIAARMRYLPEILGDDLTRWPRLRDVLETVQARPAYRAAV